MLKNLLSSIDESEFKIQRKSEKWSIHEHACHLVMVQPMIIERFKIFLNDPAPVIKPFIPGRTDPDGDLIKHDLASTVQRFSEYRIELINQVSGLDSRYWFKEAKHNEYKIYTPHILLRHALMHDHFHMYRIEQLWLTTDRFLY